MLEYAQNAEGECALGTIINIIFYISFSGAFQREKVKVRARGAYARNTEKRNGRNFSPFIVIPIIPKKNLYVMNTIMLIHKLSL